MAISDWFNEHEKTKRIVHDMIALQLAIMKFMYARPKMLVEILYQLDRS